MISCSFDSFSIYNINNNEYKVVQTLNYHTHCVNQIIELNNKKLVSCSDDKSIIFYNEENGEYKKEYFIQTNGNNLKVIQTKDKEICYGEFIGKGKVNIHFFNFFEQKTITTIDNISITGYIHDNFLMITKDILLITGNNKLSLINIDKYNLIRVIDISDSGNIFSACMLNKDMLITGDEKGRIIQWKIEGDNLKFISKKENAHDNWITTFSKIGNGHILSGSADEFIKIW